MKRLFQRLYLSSILIFTIFIQSGWTYPPHKENLESTHTNSSFIGAELFTNLAKEGHTRIILKKYYTEGLTEAPKQETVVIHEHAVAMVYKYLPLQLISEEAIKDEQPTSCANLEAKSNCMVLVTYGATLQLPVMPMGFDLVWLKPQIDDMRPGLPMDEQTSLSLSIHIPDPMIASPNVMPETKPLQNYLFCTGQQYELELASKDMDGDQVRYELSSAHSILQEEGSHVMKAIIPTNLEGLDDKISKEIQFRRPPFQQISKTPGFSYQEIKSQKKSDTFLDSKTGKLTFSPQTTGKYILGITLTDERNGTPLSSHQAIFLIEVL